jgi:hypothetical protein
VARCDSLMAVVHDNATESHTGTTGSQNQASFSWTIDVAADARAALVFVFALDSATNPVTGVSFHGSTMNAVSGGEAADTAGEPGNCKAYFIGDQINTGAAKNVVVTRTNNATIMYAVAITLKGDNALETTGVLLEQNNQTLAEENINDGTPGTNSLRYAGTFWGGASPPSVGANSTELHNIDYATPSVAASVIKETTGGQGARPLGWVQGGAGDDVAAVYLAVIERKPTVTDVETTEEFLDKQTAVTITGTNFFSTQDTGKVELSDNAVYASGTKVGQTVTSWSNTAIDFTAVLGSLLPGTLWIWVTDKNGFRNVAFIVTVHRSNLFAMAASTNIAASGEASTFQLTAPAGKNTGDFSTGRVWDDENGTDSLDHGNNKYTEYEWCMQANADVANGEIYQFRVLLGGNIPTLTVIPEWTIGTGGVTHEGAATLPIAITRSIAASMIRNATTTRPVIITHSIAAFLTLAANTTRPIVITQSTSGGLILTADFGKSIVLTESTAAAITLGGALTLPISFTRAFEAVLTLAGGTTLPVTIIQSSDGTITIAATITLPSTLSLQAAADIIILAGSTLPITITQNSAGDLVILGTITLPTAITQSSNPAVTYSGDISLPLTLVHSSNGSIILAAAFSGDLSVVESSDGTLILGAGSTHLVAITQSSDAIITILAEFTKSITINQSSSAIMTLTGDATLALAITGSHLAGIIHSADSSVSFALTISSNAFLTLGGEASLPIALTQSSVAVLAIFGTSTLPLVITQSSSAVMTYSAGLSLAMAIAQSTAGSIILEGTSSVSFSVSMTADAVRTLAGNISLQLDELLSADAQILVIAEATLALSAALSAAADLVIFGDASFNVTMSISAAGVFIRGAAAPLNITLTIQPAAGLILDANSTLPTTITLSADAKFLEFLGVLAHYAISVNNTALYNATVAAISLYQAQMRAEASSDIIQEAQATSQPVVRRGIQHGP